MSYDPPRDPIESAAKGATEGFLTWSKEEKGEKIMWKCIVWYLLNLGTSLGWFCNRRGWRCIFYKNCGYKQV